MPSGRVSERASRLLLSLLLLLAACGAHAEADATIPLLKVKVGVSATEKPPFWYKDASGNWTGYLRPILDHLCGPAAGLECELVTYSTLDERIALVESGKVDFVVGTMSATDKRAEVVDFVHPGFYSAGVALYTTPEEARMLSAAGGWDGLAGEQICFPQGYYAASALEKEYAIVPVFLPPDDGDDDKFLAAFESQNCTAYAEDDGFLRFPKLGLPQAAGVAPVMTTPYAIPVRKGNDALRRRLSGALVELMQAGPASPLLEWEQKYLTDAGVMPNAELGSVVDALSFFQ